MAETLHALSNLHPFEAMGFLEQILLDSSLSGLVSGQLKNQVYWFMKFALQSWVTLLSILMIKK